MKVWEKFVAEYPLLSTKKQPFKDEFVAQNGQNHMETDKQRKQTNNSLEGGYTICVAATMAHA